MTAQSHIVPPSGFSIRRAINNDIPAIRTVLLAVRTEYNVLCAIGANDPDLEDLEENYFHGGGLFEVVEDPARRIVGCAGLRPLSPCRAEQGKMYIEKCARRRGLGKQLLEDLLAAARAGGFQEVWLETNSALNEAAGLYRKYGFHPIDSQHLLPSCDQAYLLRLR